MARIKDAVDSISVQAAIEVLMALFSSSTVEVDTASATDALHSAPVVDTTLSLVMRFAKVMSQASALDNRKNAEGADSGALRSWQEEARQWFVSLMDALHKNADEPTALEAL